MNTAHSDLVPILAQSITFRYGQLLALDGLDVEWHSNAVGILGENGAGKTTLLRLLAGIERATSGHLEVGGTSLSTRASRSDHRSRIGYLPQNPRWLAEFSIAEFLRYFARLRLPRRSDIDQAVERALDAVDLQDSLHSRLGKLSGGQRQRAFIAQAIVHDPPILILDEPTAGLDPVQRIRLRKVLATLSRSRQVILSTHLVEDVQQLAQEVLILHRGTAAWSGTVADLTERGRSRGKEAHVSDMERGFLDAISQAEGHVREVDP